MSKVPQHGLISQVKFKIDKSKSMVTMMVMIMMMITMMIVIRIMLLMMII